MRLRGPKLVRRIFVDIETLPPDRNNSESDIRAEISSARMKNFAGSPLTGISGAS